MDAPEDKLARAAVLMQRALTESTGLKDLQQKLVIYWTLATHSLPHAKTFSLLALVGKMGTGKSQALSIIRNFAYRPVALSLRAMTTPTIRDKFAESHGLALRLSRFHQSFVTIPPASATSSSAPLPRLPCHIVYKLREDSTRRELRCLRKLYGLVKKDFSLERQASGTRPL